MGILGSVSDCVGDAALFLDTLECAELGEEVSSDVTGDRRSRQSEAYYSSGGSSRCHARRGMYSATRRSLQQVKQHTHTHVPRVHVRMDARARDEYYKCREYYSRLDLSEIDYRHS